MVKTLLLAGLLAASSSGCMIRATRARDATLHYHPTLDELRAAPRAAAPTPREPRPVAAQVVLDGFAAGYPQPVGLDYDGDGAFRKVVGVEWSAGELERALGTSLQASIASGDGSPVHLGGAIVSLAVYRFGDAVYASALLEVRLARDGTELYAARYAAAAKGNDRDLLVASVATGLVDRIHRDDQLFAALGGGAP